MNPVSLPVTSHSLHPSPSPPYSFTTPLSSCSFSLPLILLLLSPSHLAPSLSLITLKMPITKKRRPEGSSTPLVDEGGTVVTKPRTKRKQKTPKTTKPSQPRKTPKPKKMKSTGEDSEDLEDDYDELVKPGDDTVSVGVTKPSAASCKPTRKQKTPVQKKPKAASASPVVNDDVNPSDDDDVCVIGDPIEDSVARERWPQRYQTIEKSEASSNKPKINIEEVEILLARHHYLQARVDGLVYNLFDDCYIQADDGQSDYIGKIVEFFVTDDDEPYFTAKWFFRAVDTVIGMHSDLIDDRRVFISDATNENPLGCIISKIKIIKIDPNMDFAAREDAIQQCDYYYDMKYAEPYSTFEKLPNGNGVETPSTISTENNSNEIHVNGTCKMTLLDLFSGCGGMSTGLCLGAKISAIDLVTKWAVDVNPHACESLRKNHPETEVRNESADSFLKLLKEWEKLCEKFSLLGTDPSEVQSSLVVHVDEEDYGDMEDTSEDFEVEKFIDICFGDPNKKNKIELHLKVRWKGYGPEYDTWEPIEGLSNCQERMQNFVINGYKSLLLPLPGNTDIICGGPPCQGASGFNRFRNSKSPLDDEKNYQLIVFMDIVNYLKPKYVLMENVVDILRFAGGFLGRYAVSRIVAMSYQARLGMMVAGGYGLPQFRRRVFLWGAHPTQVLPQYPLPSHDVIAKGHAPLAFMQNVVAYTEGESCNVEKALTIEDAISDLPEITNDEIRDEMSYERPAQTEFQKYTRLSKHELLRTNANGLDKLEKSTLHDHLPFKVKNDDYLRVCQIPKEKGANFRNLAGVKVRPDNSVEWDQSIDRVYLPSGKPLVPDYAMQFVRGTSTKPFARVWWDEIISTVVCRPEPHNRAMLHPTQDRVLSIRENARLQGFPDYYKLCGPVKARYTQVGNAVAVPVARALGYSMGISFRGLADEKPVFNLPPKFPNASFTCNSDK